jgi:hypothetical protein
VITEKDAVALIKRLNLYFWVKLGAQGNEGEMLTIIDNIIGVKKEEKAA